jgi:hypothetical protein
MENLLHYMGMGDCYNEAESNRYAAAQYHIFYDIIICINIMYNIICINIICIKISY